LVEKPEKDNFLTSTLSNLDTLIKNNFNILWQEV
jgi:hypothetical protein